MQSLIASEGGAILFIGILAVLLAAIWMIRNVAAMFAGVFWGLSVIVLIFAGLFSVGIEAFWLSVVAATIMVIISMVLQVIS